ncbi:DUF1109 domain-containing protein [Pseudomonas yamanorum]|nr:DUF1109 domain-containing protein [Pseudomonas yamanorum]
MNTDELIAALIADLKPVRRLRPPAWRLVGWLAMSIPVTALLVATMRTRPDLAVKLSDPVFMTEQLASLATVLIAGWSALVAGVPGEARWKMWAPVAPLALWIASLGHQCWDEWVRLGINGMVFHPDFMCVPAIAMISAVPSLSMVLAIRRGARVRTSTAVLWGSLAAAALANVGLRMFHTEDAALMVIVWQFGSVLLLMALAMLLRNYLVPKKWGTPGRG